MVFPFLCSFRVLCVGSVSYTHLIQGRRIDAHIILDKSIKEIAEAEGVHEESIRQSIKRGLERMKKTF